MAKKITFLQNIKTYKKNLQVLLNNFRINPKSLNCLIEQSTVARCVTHIDLHLGIEVILADQCQEVTGSKNYLKYSNASTKSN